MQNSFAVTCSDCGGVTTVEFTGELKPEDLVCKFCGAALKIPKQYAHLASENLLRQELMQTKEVVEALAEANAARASVQSPRVIHPPKTGFERPTTYTVPAKKAGCLIGGISGASCLGILLFTVAMVAIPLVAMGQMNKVVKNISNQVSNALGTNTIDVRRTLKGLTIQADQLTYSPDGRLIAGASSLQVIIWDVQSGAKVVQLPQSFSTEALAFTPDSKQLVASNGSNLTFYSTSDGHVIQTFDCRCSAFALSPDGKTVAASNYDNQITLWSASSGTAIRTLDTVTFNVSHLLFSPDQRFVVAGTTGSSLAVWDAPTGKKVFEGDSNVTSTDVMAFQPGQNTLVIGRDNHLEFYQVDDKGFRYVKAQTINDSFFDIQGLVFSPDGKEIAMGNFFDDVWIWNIAEKSVTHKLKSQYGITQVAYSPDGSFVVGAGSIGDVYEWQLHDQPAAVNAPTLAPTNVPAPTVAAPNLPLPAANTPTPGSPALPIACSIQPSGPNANLRSGPGTGYAITGKLVSQASVNGQKTDADGYTWWRLADGRGWVRQDVVQTSGNCDQLPQVP